LLEAQLDADGLGAVVLDGDDLRSGLNRDLGFSQADRSENIRRAAEVAKLLVTRGLIVIVATISPLEADRRLARSILSGWPFLEVFIDTPLDVAERRDPKGLYALVRQGRLQSFTGVDAPYEAPRRPDVRIDTTAVDPHDAVDVLLAHLRSR
jgi:bifunctional enzyme CysN/CysC